VGTREGGRSGLKEEGYEKKAQGVVKKKEVCGAPAWKTLLSVRSFESKAEKKTKEQCYDAMGSDLGVEERKKR